MSEASKGAVARNLALEGELLRLTRLLSPLRVVSFKGPLLTRRLHGSLAARQSVDLDIWVRPEEGDAVLRELRKGGYSPLPYVDAEAALHRKGSVNLYEGQGGARRSVDLHVEPFSTVLFEVPHDLIEEHLEEFPLHDTKVLTFDAELAFVHMIAHFVKHRFERRVLRDVAIAWDSWAELADVGRIEALAARTCTVEAFEYSVWACCELGWSKREFPHPKRTRARVVARLFPPHRLLESRSEGYWAGLWSTFLVRPVAIPQLALRGVYLAPEAAAARYQEAPSWRLTWRRLGGPLRELKDRWAKR